MRRAVLALLVVVAMVPVLRSAQASQAPTQPAFRAGTTLVEVSAIVTHDGRPVTDLRADEVTVFDNGEPQALVAFERVDLGRGEVAAQRRDFVVVLDDLHIHPARTQPAIDAALAFIERLGPHDRLAVVTTGPPDDVLDLTTDREVARASVRRMRGASLTASVVPGEFESRGRAAMDILRQVAAGVQSDAAERRAILLVSEGHAFFNDEVRLRAMPVMSDVYSAFLEVLREAALANIAIYTIDPRGLRAPGGASVASRSMVTASDIGQVTSTMPSSMLSSDLGGSLASLAINTGGIQTRWTNDLTANFDRLVSDSRQYYRLAYVQPDPTPGRKQPSSRTIKVKVSRDDVDVRARQRYAPTPTGRR